MSKIRSLIARIPPKVRRDAGHVALVFLAGFAVAAKPLLPALTHTHGIADLRALLLSIAAAGAVAGYKAARPIAARYLVQLIRKSLRR